MSLKSASASWCWSPCVDRTWGGEPHPDLLANHNISGVVLLASNDNFVDTPNTSQATALISERSEPIIRPACRPPG
jgi:hypothetical protein